MFKKTEKKRSYLTVLIVSVITIVILGGSLGWATYVKAEKDKMAKGQVRANGSKDDSSVGSQIKVSGAGKKGQSVAIKKKSAVVGGKYIKQATTNKKPTIQPTSKPSKSKAVPKQALTKITPVKKNTNLTKTTSKTTHKATAQNVVFQTLKPAKYTVTANALAIRQGANTNDRIIGTATKGETVLITQKSPNWYKVTFNNITGYAHAIYLTPYKYQQVLVTAQKEADEDDSTKKQSTSSVKKAGSSNNSRPSAVEQSAPPQQPVTSKLLNVPLIRQMPELPSGCEVTALSMALAYYGVQVSNTTLANEMPYDRTPREVHNGVIQVWGDPEKGYVGNPYGVGITINPNPLKTLLDKYRSGGIALYGQDFSVIENYVKLGKPTLVWFTVNYQMPINRYWKTPTGKTISAPRPLHCIVVTGVDSNYVYFNDSEPAGGKNVRVPINRFINVYNAMGRRALVVN